MIQPSAISPYAKTFPSVVAEIERLRGTDPRRWLVLGKGPTADYRHAYDLTRFHVITLNHAARVWPTATFHHFVDFEAFKDCIPDLREDAGIVMPWYPHVKCRVNHRDLPAYVKPIPHLFRYFSYHASVHKLPKMPWLPRLTLRCFSATAVFAALVQARVPEIFSLGVDGGVGYARDFDKKDHLANGQTSFDVQTPVIRNLCRPPRRDSGRHGRANWIPLTAQAPAWCRKI